jgi:hypothetical protein
VFYAGNRAKFSAMSPDSRREIFRKKMEEIEAVYPGTFPEVAAEKTKQTSSKQQKHVPLSTRTVEPMRVAAVA